MTKGELMAYTSIRGSLMSLLARVEDYCRDYNCGRELIKECEDIRKSVAQADKDFNKGKRKK